MKKNAFEISNSIHISIVCMKLEVFLLIPFGRVNEFGQDREFGWDHKFGRDHEIERDHKFGQDREFSGTKKMQ